MFKPAVGGWEICMRLASGLEWGKVERTPSDEGILPKVHLGNYNK